MPDQQQDSQVWLYQDLYIEEIIDIKQSSVLNRSTLSQASRKFYLKDHKTNKILKIFYWNYYLYSFIRFSQSQNFYFYFIIFQFY
jgi:hypothetical protein